MASDKRAGRKKQGSERKKKKGRTRREAVHRAVCVSRRLYLYMPDGARLMVTEIRQNERRGEGVVSLQNGEQREASER